MGVCAVSGRAILYRNGLITRMTTFTGPYIGGAGSVKPGEPTTGIFGLEGSKAGAAAASVYLSHRVIRPDTTGYGKIINQSMRNVKEFYARLAAAGIANRSYAITTLAPSGEINLKERRHIYDRLLSKLQEASPTGMQEALADPELSDILRNQGPDQNIVDYVFNFKYEDGYVNTDPQAFDAFNQAVYDAFHVDWLAIDKGEKRLQDYPVLISSTRFDRSVYGDTFMNSFASRIGLAQPREIGNLICLRSTVMSPYLMYTEAGSFLAEILNIFDKEMQLLVPIFREKYSQPKAES